MLRCMMCLFLIPEAIGQSSEFRDIFHPYYYPHIIDFVTVLVYLTAVYITNYLTWPPASALNLKNQT